MKAEKFSKLVNDKNAVISLIDNGLVSAFYSCYEEEKSGRKDTTADAGAFDNLLTLYKNEEAKKEDKENSKNFNDFVAMLNKKRGDICSSDREAAAALNLYFIYEAYKEAVKDRDILANV